MAGEQTPALAAFGECVGKLKLESNGFPPEIPFVCVFPCDNRGVAMDTHFMS